MSRNGLTLAIVLWTLVALGALAVVASSAARMETLLQTRYRAHAAALGLAEAGLAEARAALAIDPGRVPDSVVGTLATGRFEARWVHDGGMVEVRSVGRAGSATRAIEAWIELDAVAPRVVAWREAW